jgi:telomerase protein component 1
MKLPIPETWETLLSAKGNKAATWEELIDHKVIHRRAARRDRRR